MHNARKYCENHRIFSRLSVVEACVLRQSLNSAKIVSAKMSSRFAYRWPRENAGILYPNKGVVLIERANPDGNESGTHDLLASSTKTMTSRRLLLLARTFAALCCRRLHALWPASLGAPFVDGLGGWGEPRGALVRPVYHLINARPKNGQR
jgi:hypothetical protein